MTWKATVEDGVIVCTDGDRRLEAMTNEAHPTNIAGLLSGLLNGLDYADGNPYDVTVKAKGRYFR